MSREVIYSAMGCKPLDDIAHSGHRNIKISGDGLVALRLSMFFQFFSLKSSKKNSLHFFPFFTSSSVRDTTQRFSQLFSILIGCKCDYYIAHTCYLPQVSKYKLQEHHMLENYFLQFCLGANNFVQSIFEFCVKFSQV